MLREFFQGFKVPHKLYWDASYEKILEVQQNSTSLNTDYWLHQTLGRWYWWFLLFWMIFPLFIWWKYTDRSRFLEVSFFGLLVSLCAGILDTVGIFLGQWTYPYKLLPFLPNFFPIDYFVIPAFFMLVYQKYPEWKGFIIASTVMSTIFSLILDPVMVWMNIYQPLSWQYIYSVPVFIFMTGFCKYLTMFITAQDTKYGGLGRGKKAA